MGPCQYCMTWFHESCICGWCVKYEVNEITIYKEFVPIWKLYILQALAHYIAQRTSVNFCPNRLPIWFHNISRWCWFWPEGGTASQHTASVGPQLGLGTVKTLTQILTSLLGVSLSARTAQRQCCLGSLKESRCFSGMNAAREGVVCEVDNNDQCGADSYKVKVLPMVLLVGWCYTRVVGLIPT